MPASSFCQRKRRSSPRDVARSEPSLFSSHLPFSPLPPFSFHLPSSSHLPGYFPLPVQAVAPLQASLSPPPHSLDAAAHSFPASARSVRPAAPGSLCPACVVREIGRDGCWDCDPRAFDAVLRPGYRYPSVDRSVTVHIAQGAHSQLNSSEQYLWLDSA